MNPYDAFTFAASALLHALCATHPDPVRLQSAFVFEISRVLSQLEQHPLGPTFAAEVRQHCDNLLGRIPAA